MFDLKRFLRRAQPGRRAALKQASATIEAALLMPFILLILFATITLDFFAVSRAVCESAACEQAVTGRVREDLFLPGTRAALRGGSDSPDLREVSFRTETASIYGRYVLPIEAEASYRKVHPVRGIRVFRAAAGLMSGG